MSIKIIYTCDRCLIEQDAKQSPLWTVGIKAAPAHYTSDSFVSGDFKMEVCRACLEDLGIHTSERVKADPAYNPPSLEELIREIVARCS